MMKPTELRIGNYVRAKSPERTKWEEPVKVTIDYLEMFCRKIPAVHFDPIPLTEDWLMKFGFSDYQKTDDPERLNEYQQEGVKIYWMKENYLFICKNGTRHFRAAMSGACYDESTGLHDFSSDLEHVHQLQNLFYAITGEELNTHQNPELL